MFLIKWFILYCILSFIPAHIYEVNSPLYFPSSFVLKSVLSCTQMSQGAYSLTSRRQCLYTGSQAL